MTRYNKHFFLYALILSSSWLILYDDPQEIRKRNLLPKNPEIFKEVQETNIPTFNLLTLKKNVVGDSVLFSSKALKLFKTTEMQPYIVREACHPIKLFFLSLNYF